jgi:raffinose/stachyose/melibiose transport system substrate-binding protein
MLSRRHRARTGLGIALLLAALLAPISLPPAHAAGTHHVSWWNWDDALLSGGDTQTVGYKTNARLATKTLAERDTPGLRVDETSYPYANYLTALKTAFASGTEPDVVDLQPGAMLQQYESYLVPINNFAAKLWGPNWQSRYEAIGVRQAMGPTPKKGILYGLPADIFDGTGLYYNRTIFSRYGLAVPRTYAELKHVAEVLNAHGVIPIAWGAKEQWPNVDWYLMVAEQVAPGRWDQAQNGKARFTDPKLVEALQILVKMQKDRIFGRSSWATSQYPEALTLLLTGRAAMWASGSWDAHTIWTAKNHDDYALMPIPRLAPDAGPGHLFGGVNFVMCVTKAAKDPAEAFKLVAWRAGAPGQRAIAMSRWGYLSSVKGMKGTFPWNAAYQERVWSYWVTGLGTAIDREPKLAAVKQALQDAIAAASTQGQSAARAMAAVQTAYDQNH